MVQGLHVGTEYTVTINPIFVDIEGPVTTAKAKTREFCSLLTKDIQNGPEWIFDCLQI